MNYYLLNDDGSAFVECCYKNGNTKGLVHVDQIDMPVLKTIRWHITVQGYCSGWRKDITGRNTSIRMHRIIKDTDDHNLYVDHINHDILDNRKVNLREVTPFQNQMNRQSNTGSSSKYRGVSFCKANGKWMAMTSRGRVNMYLGYFETEKEAATAVNTKLKEIGEGCALYNK